MSHESTNTAFRLRLAAERVRSGEMMAAIREAMLLEGLRPETLADLRDPADVAARVERIAGQIEGGR